MMMAGWFEDVFLTTMGVYTTTTTTTTTNRIIQRRLLLRFYYRQQQLRIVAVLIILVLLLALVVVSGQQDTGKTNENSGDGDSDGDHNNILQWQRCSVFIAPSLPMTTDNDNDTDNTNFNFNWGVYANRKFSKGDIVDISPLTLPVPDGSNAIERSVLNDYVYGYWRVFQQPNTNTKNNANNNKKRQRPTIDKLYSVLFGPDMFYNHHPTTPNVEFTTFGREPDRSSSSSSISLKNAMNIQGFVALRTIERGEELFTSYNGKEDGGESWFQRRGLKMVTPPQSKSKSLSTSTSKSLFFDLYSNQYCSKIYAGVGRPSWEDRLLPILPPKNNYNHLPFSIDDIQLPKFDAGVWDAKTKIANIKKGDRLEISTALVLSLEFTRKTSLMPLVYTWQDLHQEHRSALKRLAHDNLLRLQYQGPDTNWMPMNNFTTTTTTGTGTGAGAIPNYDDLVLFPVAGNIGMVRRRRTVTPSTLDAHTSGGGGGGGGSSGATSTSSNDDAEKPNCRLVVHSVVNNHDDNNNNNNNNNDDNNNDPSSFLEHPVGVTIELIAMEDMMIAGTDLIVDVYESVATPFEYQLLYRELKLTGQPYNQQIFQHRRRQKQQQQQQQQQQRNNKRTSTSPSSSSSSSTTTTTTTTIPAKEEL